MVNPIGFIRGVVKAEQEFADFIQNGPSDGIGGYARDQYRKRCEQFSNLPGWARALSRGPAGSLGRVCKPYLDTIPADLPQAAPPPFTGGQCPGVRYSYQIVITSAQGVDGTPQTVTCGANHFGPFSLSREQNGQIVTWFLTRQNATGGTVKGTLATSNSQITARIQNVQRCDGQADNCGDPPSPGLEPGPNPAPDPGPTPGPEPTDDPNSPIPFIPIPPFSDPVGGPTPIEAPAGDPVPVDPTSIPGNTDSQPGGPENVGDPIEVDPGAGGGGDDTLFGDPPTGRVWVGALLQFDVPDGYGNIPNSGPANLVTPRVFANASLVFANGRGTAYRVNSGNIDLMRSTGALQVLGVYVNCSPGITYNVRPVSVEQCPENTCGVE